MNKQMSPIFLFLVIRASGYKHLVALIRGRQRCSCPPGSHFHKLQAQGLGANSKPKFCQS